MAARWWLASGIGSDAAKRVKRMPTRALFAFSLFAGAVLSAPAAQARPPGPASRSS